ncbi:MAG: hypothetical protein U0401_22390 [Anaerolineae bacterium]
MQREEALEKIAFHHLKKLSREEAIELIVQFLMSHSNQVSGKN